MVVRDLETARSAMDAIRGVHTGRVDISSMPSPGIEPLTSMIAAFRRRHPNVSISVDGAFSPDDVIAAVRTGTAEVGLLGSASELRIPGVRSLPLLAQPLVLIVNPAEDHFGDASAVRREDLAGVRLIVSQPGSLMRSMVDDLLATGTTVDLAVEVAHRTSILPLVLAGVGHAVMPASWVPLAAHSGLRTLRITPASQLHVSVVSRADHLSAAAIGFLEVAREFAST
ncbi:MAG: LysR family transcriptional regulator substrate-binding protein [Agrococcus sp.]